MVDYIDKTLDNSLRVIVNQDNTTELVAVNMLYKVGAKNEQETHTGFAHLFEHLMFSGSENFPDFDIFINSIGGESNAFTNNDYTNYYISVPKIYLETVLRVEADRMRNLIIDQQHLSVQKRVVIEEFKQRYLNQPYGDVHKLMRELSYKVHPYRWQTIGMDISHIENASLDIVRNFYDTYYQPNNAILTISGNVNADEVFALCKEIFSYPKGNDIEDNIPMEPLQTENRVMTVYRDVPSNVIVITFPMSRRNAKQYYTFDLISDVLSNGKSSRLYNALVLDKQLFTEIDAVVSADHHEGMFIVLGKYSDGVDIKQGEQTIWQILKDLTQNPPSERELQKVKNKNLSTATFGNQKILDKAMNLAFYEFHGMLENINLDKDYYKQVSAEDIRLLADKTFFGNKHNTLYYLTKENNK